MDRDFARDTIARLLENTLRDHQNMKKQKKRKLSRLPKKMRLKRKARESKLLMEVAIRDSEERETLAQNEDAIDNSMIPNSPSLAQVNTLQ